MKKLNLLIILLLMFSLFVSGCGDDTVIDGDIDGDSENTDGDEDSEAVDGDKDAEEDGDMEETEQEIDEESAPVSLIDYVDPFIGTGGPGFNVGSGLPGATAPFGMLKVSPDTSEENGAFPAYHCGGYNDMDDYILGFSHTHLYGVGITEYGDFIVMPTFFDAELVNPFMQKKYRSLFKKETEVATPGYYAVTLDDTKIRVELTATERAAHHRYTYPESKSSQAADVLLDFSEAIADVQIKDGSIKVDKDAKTVEGWVLNHGSFSGRYGGIDVYFVARFNREIKSFITRNAGTIETDIAEQSGAETGAVLTFDLAEGNVVEMQAAISFVSIEQAWLNLNTEMPEWDFEATHAATRANWEEQMSFLTLLEGGTEDQRVKLATSMFHLFMAPNIFSDVNGKYVGFDDQIHETDTTYYTDFSMWDTYRTLHPLLSLVRPDVSGELIKSLLLMAEQGGSLPKWPQGKGYTGCMVSSPADTVIADAYVKDVTGFDADFAFSEMLKHAKGPVVEVSREDVEHYNEHGYVKAESGSGSVSKTMEHAVNDYAIYQMALKMGETEEAAHFKEQSKNYKNLWDPVTKFFRGKNEDGTWDGGDIAEEDFDTILNHSYYTEGNAWQYLWLVPQDMAGLMGLMGSAEAMTERLDYLFTEAEKHQQFLVDNPEDIAVYVPPPYYWHGNEPDIHAAYMFLQSGRPDLTQKWVHWISEELYDTDAAGIPGNDDCGTLSAWYVFSSMGFYPVPSSSMYMVGRPLFKLLEITTKGGTLRIEAPEAGGENIYVQSVTLNDTALEVPYFDHSDIINGGILHFEMGPNPSEWGKVDTIPQYAE